MLYAPLLAFGTLAAILVAQARFYDAWFARFGEPTARQRFAWLKVMLPRYWSLALRAPYDLKTILNKVPDPTVEHRRKQLLLSIGAFGGSAALGMLLTSLSFDAESPVPIGVALIYLGLVWLGILRPAPSKGGAEARPRERG